MNSCFSLVHGPEKAKQNKTKKKLQYIKGITQKLGSASCVLWLALLDTYSQNNKTGYARALKQPF